MMFMEFKVLFVRKSCESCMFGGCEGIKVEICRKGDITIINYVLNQHHHILLINVLAKLSTAPPQL